MPRKKLAISFGLVSIPVHIEKAIRSHDIRFNLLCKDSGARVEYRKVCPGKKEVTTSDLVRGYQYADGEYVTLSAEELELLKTKKDKAINIISFIKPGTIDAIYFDEPYILTPQEAGKKAFDLLYQSMQELELWAIAKSVLNNRERLMTLRPSAAGILVQTLHYSDEVVHKAGYEAAKPKKEEMAMAKNLIKALVQPFRIEDYEDEYREKLEKAISDKVAGKKITKSRDPQNDRQSSIMDALQNSIKHLREQGKTARR